MYSGPHHKRRGNRLASRKLTIVMRLCDHRWTGAKRSRCPVHGAHNSAHLAAAGEDIVLREIRGLCRSIRRCAQVGLHRIVPYGRWVDKRGHLRWLYVVVLTLGGTTTSIASGQNMCPGFVHERFVVAAPTPISSVRAPPHAVPISRTVRRTVQRAPTLCGLSALSTWQRGHRMRCRERECQDECRSFVRRARHREV